jgi:hypothetical protein
MLKNLAGIGKIKICGNDVLVILEKSVGSRKTKKARKNSKRYQAVDHYPKGEWLCNTIV